jgi:hypothetical protein
LSSCGMALKNSCLRAWAAVQRRFGSCVIIIFSKSQARGSSLKGLLRTVLWSVSRAQRFGCVA